LDCGHSPPTKNHRTRNIHFLKTTLLLASAIVDNKEREKGRKEAGSKKKEKAPVQL